MRNSPFADGVLIAYEDVGWTRFDEALAQSNVSWNHRVHYRRWVESYLRLGLECREGDESTAYSKQLEREGKPDWQCRQAFHAVQLWFRLERGATPAPVQPDAVETTTWDEVIANMAVNLRAKRYSRYTISAYVDWAKRFGRIHPRVPTESDEVSQRAQAFLDELTLSLNLSPASVSQARNALAWLVKRELGLEMTLADKGASHHSKRLPTVYSPATIRSILDKAQRPWDLFFGMQYGCGFRLRELLEMRVQDIDLSRMVVVVRSGKGDKDRLLPFPHSLKERLVEHLRERKRLWIDDLPKGYAKVDLPFAMARKIHGIDTSWDWQHVFGATRPLRHPESGDLRRWRPMEPVVRRVLRELAERAGVTGRIHPHLLRHCYATHLIELGVPLADLQNLMGHARMETTMIYLHIRSPIEVRISPLDRLP